MTQNKLLKYMLQVCKEQIKMEIFNAKIVYFIAVKTNVCCIFSIFCNIFKCSLYLDMCYLMVLWLNDFGDFVTHRIMLL